MHAQFPRINTVAILCCTVVMYVAMVRLDLKIPGYVIGFATRFGVEFIWEVIHLYRHFPPQLRMLPSLADLRDNLGETMRFSLVFAVGYSSEIFMFEAVPFILLRSAHPTNNIALWMSLYQIGGISNPARM